MIQGETQNFVQICTLRISFVRKGSMTVSEQYAGTLEVWKLKKGGDSNKCTCLKLDGRAMSWIDRSELEAIS